MKEKDWKVIEYVIEALLIWWLGYLFLYQNYLLHRWHRGLPLPAKWPFVLGGLAMASVFLAYEFWRLEKDQGGGARAREG
ncbi:hypothetical protein [Thermococcus sp.]|uniref:hypothetical protein n=1 Tax=Thermococcus sp. TaxID=35749 RepID=UPI00261912C9|nr:hypothetical protein [Thermococcus sp.]